MADPGASENRGLIIKFGPLTVDVPRSLGYYGAIGLAVGAGVIEPPLGVFIAAVPLLKMMTNRLATTPVRFVGQVFDGAAQPVGGDGQGTIRLDTAAVGKARDSMPEAGRSRANGRVIQATGSARRAPTSRRSANRSKQV